MSYPIESTRAWYDWLAEVMVSAFLIQSSHTDVYLVKSSMNSMYYRLSHKVGVGKGPHTSECTSSKGFVLRLTGTLMNLSFSLAWMQTVHIES